MSAAGLFTIGVVVTLISLWPWPCSSTRRSSTAATRRPARRPTPSRRHPRARSASSRPRAPREAARAAGSFATLVTAIDRAGLSDVLEDDGPSPSDEAFAKLPVGTVESLLATPEALADVVNYHLVPGRMTAADIGRRISAETLQGKDLAISNNGAVRIDGARLVSTDIEASNGVIHIIDRVLLPARI